MSDEETKVPTMNDLARERNRLSGDRTLLAWLRTSLALIGFGFAIAQAFEYVDAGYLDETGTAIDPMNSGYYFGISFMILGVLGALAGIAQNLRVLKELRVSDPTFTEPWPFAMVMSMLLVIIGTFGIVAVLI